MRQAIRQTETSYRDGETPRPVADFRVVYPERFTRLASSDLVVRPRDERERNTASAVLEI